ncbi:hypothetical protein LX15_001556 [Streptoalloteichus tenebrarius]|uniref:Uncharacterized protein n=1 Tax=Streptoalloteichus tenebrarius (strain ATCC 17920 / DSM 40477 / JCM 4838 / CBS 697.72 / NBRC 16177 / NCIMB 11028 / NRRL B-12390 / A12253. 1 / ISP 5477) TaxID=1933 RepID=A0ABT1HQZ7_STRSD|nr:DUF6191 domain-containing protein [Streptoalloteichus tenebrarius]MCP2257870.1 hypothetical protein [Streptoalloteichus tenebrarius]BFE99767.1 hypothetical protein GCM10020241_14430 [Streptoalloteichus tenebrarius]
MSLGEMFEPASRFLRDQREWVQFHRREQKEAGDGPLDLDSGVVRLARPSGDDTTD